MGSFKTSIDYAQWLRGALPPENWNSPARELAKLQYKLSNPCWRSPALTLTGASFHWRTRRVTLKIIAEMFWGRAAHREARLCSGIEFIKVQESSLQRGCDRQWKMLYTAVLMDLCPLWIHHLKRLYGVQSSWNIQCNQKRAETLVLLEPPCCWSGDCTHNRDCLVFRNINVLWCHNRLCNLPRR